MIPYEELERALARWKTRPAKEADTPEPTGDDMGSVPQSLEGLPAPMEQTGEIDINSDVVESVDVHRRHGR